MSASSKQPATDDLSGKVLVACGAVGSVLSAVVRHLARRGAQLVLVGVDTASEQLQQLATSCDRVAKHGNRWHLTGTGKWQPVQRALSFWLEESDAEQQVAGIVAAVLQQFGRVDSLVFCWGTGPVDGIGTESLMANLDRTMRRQLARFVHLVQQLSAALQQSGGAVVNLVPAVDHPDASRLSSCVARAAVDMLIKCLALELGPSGVRLNSVNYQARDGPAAVAGFEVNQQLLDQYLERCRGVDEDQVAAAVLYLITDRGAFLNGIALQVSATADQR